MGFSGIHISGHSGTDFKHKKVFENRKGLSVGESAQNNKIFNTEKFGAFTEVNDPSKRNSSTNHLLGYLMIVVAIGGFFFLVKLVSAIESSMGAYNKETLEMQLAAKNKSAQHIYQFLNKSGDLALNRGDVLRAVEEYQRATKLLPQRREAYVGLARALLLCCLEHELYCEASKSYEGYLKG